MAHCSFAVHDRCHLLACQRLMRLWSCLLSPAVCAQESCSALRLQKGKGRRPTTFTADRKPAGRVGGRPELNRLLHALWRLSAHLGSVQLTTRLVPGPPGPKVAALAQAVHMHFNVSHWL